MVNEGLDKFTWADRNAALDIGAKDQDQVTNHKRKEQRTR
jgi:hypothetical protein